MSPSSFRGAQDGTPIDFILTSPLHDGAIAEARLVPTAKLKPAGEKLIGARDHGLSAARMGKEGIRVVRRQIGMDEQQSQMNFAGGGAVVS